MEIKKSHKHTLFNPAFIDDYGFNAYEFRIFARIMRRSLGSDKGCYESIPRLVEALGISEKLVRQSLNVLESCGAITRTVRQGKSDLLDFNPCDHWKSSTELPAIREQFAAERNQKDRDRKAAQKSQVVAEPTGVSGGRTTRSVVAEPTGVVVAEPQDEGIKDKSLISQEGNPKKVKRENAPTATTATALSIYREYFPNFELTPYQTDLLTHTTSRLNDFRTAVEFWATNGYQERNIFGLLDRYRQEAEKTPPAPPIPLATELPTSRDAEMLARGFPKMGGARSC